MKNDEIGELWKKQTLSALFKTLPHELMTGEHRINEIEFPYISQEARQ